MKLKLRTEAVSKPRGEVVSGCPGPSLWELLSAQVLIPGPIGCDQEAELICIKQEHEDFPGDGPVVKNPPDGTATMENSVEIS